MIVGTQEQMKVAGLTADDCRDSIGSNKNIQALNLTFWGSQLFAKCRNCNISKFKLSQEM